MLVFSKSGLLPTNGEIQMNDDFKNPFADYGNIVYGDRFIGRKDDLRIVEDRVIHPRESGNLAIIGEPRIGKSSLIYKCIMERKAELISRNILPIWINLATYEHIPDFFCSLVTHCLDEIVKLNWTTEPIRHSARYVRDDRQSWSEKYSRIQRFFENVRDAGYRVIFILDEFDNARKIFRGDISGFQKLRELSYRPEWRVTFVTTSRRSIREIELQTQAISTFDGIFHKHYLAMFCYKDIEEYFKKFSSIGLSLSHDEKERIIFYCGSHPYLLEMLGYEILEMFRKDHKIDVDEAAYRIEQSFVDYYEHILELLKEDRRFNKLLQILFGPVVDVKRTDIDNLLKYGLIRLTSGNAYVGFSEHFHSYLNMVQREVNLWPVWNKTEKTLRHLITTTMEKNYGENWIENIEKAHPKLKAIFDKCREAQQREEKSFGSRASHNLVDFTYPQDLFTIIFAEWKIFGPIFGKDKIYWGQRISLLSKIRNPLAHNREESLHDYERQIAEGYCNEILRLLMNKKDSLH